MVENFKEGSDRVSQYALKLAAMGDGALTRRKTFDDVEPRLHAAHDVAE
jgi:hypothetical protein